jgi:hypothetical protein
MNAAKRPKSGGRFGESAGWLARLRRGGWEGLGGVALVLGLALLAIVVAWQRWGSGVLEDSRRLLTAENLAMTPQPDWIDPATDVKAEAIRDGSLLKVNLLDDQASVQIARAFELHSWVRKVNRVQKQAPGNVVVELEYRRPVALVEVFYNEILSYEPVDVDGVVLPEDLFHRDARHLENYVRITADYSMPSGPLGTRWGDPRIHGAARIAGLLEKVWKPWNLHRIVALPADDPSRRPTFEIRGRGSSRILWGHAPGEEAAGEAAPVQKLTWLAEFLRQRGPLDQEGSSPQDIDLRLPAGLQATPRTASR